MTYTIPEEVLEGAFTPDKDWALVTVDESVMSAGATGWSNIAMPASWLKKGVEAELMGQREAESRADFTVAPGSLNYALQSIDDLFTIARDLYSLSDEGYISSAHALEALAPRS